MKRLTRWQRIGVILSVLWMLGGTIYVSNWVLQGARERSLVHIELCQAINRNAAPTAQQDCMKAGLEAGQRGEHPLGVPFLAFAAGVSAITLALAWLSFFIVRGTIRWVMRGEK